MFKMVRIKPKEEIIENYAMSAVVGAIKYERKLRKKGWQDSMEKARRYGVKMLLSSGVPIERISADLAEIEDAAKAFRGLIESMSIQSQ